MEHSDVFEHPIIAPEVLQSNVTHLGVDLGTNTTVLSASVDGKPVDVSEDQITTVVGFPKKGIIPGILPSDSELLFGEEAINYRLHLDLNWPLKEGFVRDTKVCGDFADHLRSLVDPGRTQQIWGVVGAPANSSPEREKDIRAAVGGLLDRLLVVPEPFLAAMGLRGDPSFQRLGVDADPTKHSLIVDIGAGTTDLCLVRGYFPTAEDMISVNRAGDFIDELIFAGIQRRYPDIKLTSVTVRQIKEEHSFVSGFERDAHVKVYVDGRPRVLDFSDMISEACDELIPSIVEGIQDLLKRCDSDSAVQVMQNIIITGGGSRVHGLCEKVERLLHESEYDCARCIAPTEYKKLVSRGALKIAENVRDDQWQFSV